MTGTPKEGEENPKDEKVDMRHVLGHLNQNEWILGLNIGDVIQI